MDPCFPSCCVQIVLFVKRDTPPDTNTAAPLAWATANGQLWVSHFLRVSGPERLRAGQSTWWQSNAGMFGGINQNTAASIGTAIVDVDSVPVSVFGWARIVGLGPHGFLWADCECLK